MTRFEYQGDPPEEAKSILVAIFKKYEWLMPNWMDRLWITWVPVSNETSPASCEINYAYRWGRIFVKPAWFSSTPEDRESILLHEMLHFYFNLVADYQDEIIGLLVGDKEKVEKLVMAEVARRTESAICDLERKLFERLKDA